jgi:hypothetical protein
MPPSRPPSIPVLPTIESSEVMVGIDDVASDVGSPGRLGIQLPDKKKGQVFRQQLV